MMIPSQKGPWALLHKAVGYFPEKGGGADVEKAAARCAAVTGMSGGNAVHTHHKSVLAVRLVPERLAR